MNHIRRLTRALVALAGALMAPVALSAQDSGPAFQVVPMLGFGMVSAGNSRNSAGLETAVDLTYGDAAWRWSAYASERGIGVGCSESCFEGGPAFAAGVSRAIGRVWIGAAAGTMHQHGRWRFVPQGRLAVATGRLWLETRVELPQQDGSGAYFPVLVGIPLGR